MKIKRKTSVRYFYAKLTTIAPLLRTTTKLRSRTVVTLFILLFSTALTACSANRATTNKVEGIALSVVGIGAPEHRATSSPPKNIRVQLDAAKDLNQDDDGQGLSTIVRLYKLKDRNAFLLAPYSAFGHSEREKQAFGRDLMDVHELMITPGQRLELDEKMTDDMAYLGVVTLFRSPDRKRWRFVFAAKDAEALGITLGLHTCAMTATSVSPIGMTLNDATLLSSVKCK